jgi:hypothetical protein
MLNRVRIGLGIATIATGLALVPAIAPAAATVSRVSAVSAVSSVRASALCGAYKNEGSSLAKTQGSAIAKAAASGNWSAVQKAFLSSFGSATNALKQLNSTLGGAPSNVKSAVNTFINFEGQIKSAVQSSTSFAQFGAKIEAVSTNPKLQAAEKTLNAYGQKLCPGSVPKTPTT